jgi:hypothetical protein
MQQITLPPELWVMILEIKHRNHLEVVRKHRDEIKSRLEVFFGCLRPRPKFIGRGRLLRCVVRHNKRYLSFCFNREGVWMGGLDNAYSFYTRRIRPTLRHPYEVDQRILSFR